MTQTSMSVTKSYRRESCLRVAESSFGVITRMSDARAGVQVALAGDDATEYSRSSKRSQSSSFRWSALASER